mgnify:CR=1 FL=1
MHLADELEHLVARVAVQHMVEQVPDKELHRRPFLGRDRRPVRRVALVVRIVEHGGLSLVEVHRGALALIHVDDLAHPLRGALAPEQEATAPFQKGAEVVNVGTGKVVEEDFENEKGDVDGRDAELGQFGEEAQVLCAGCRGTVKGQLLLSRPLRSITQAHLGPAFGEVCIPLPLQVPELVLELLCASIESSSALWSRREIAGQTRKTNELTRATSSLPMSGMYGFKVPTSLP